MLKLQSFDTFQINQEKEWREIVSGLDGQNRYCVSSGAERLFIAVEKEGGIIDRFVRVLLRSARPFEIELVNVESREGIIRIRRPFNLTNKIVVETSLGVIIGSVEKRFSANHNIYFVNVVDGDVFCSIEARLFSPRTFSIKGADGKICGAVVKEWGGVIKEALSDADCYNINLPADWDDNIKLLVLCSTFLIDFVHFENKLWR